MLTGATIALIALMTAAAKAQEGQLKLDEASLQPGLSRLQTTIQDAVRAAGGDLESQGVNLVLAFKTANFKDDPVRASAARSVASSLVQDLLVSGDRVTVRSYEFGLWDSRPVDSSTAQITTNSRSDPTKIAEFSRLLPTTPRAGSQGGHDTERAIVELGEAYSNASDTIIVLLSNVAASQGAPGERLLGSNDPAYLSVLERWTRVPGTQGGASVELPFKVNVPNASPNEAKLEAVVLVPKTFTGATLSGGTRSELLSGATATTTAPATTSGGGGFPWLLLLIPVLLAGAYFLLRGRSGGGGGNLKLEVNGQSYSLADVSTGRTVLTLVGRGNTQSVDGAVLEVDKAPTAPFARISRDQNGVRVEAIGSDFTLDTVDDLPAEEPARIRYDPAKGEHALAFSGNVTSTTGSKRKVNLTVALALVREG
jgi:hypothetical protein